MRYLFSAKNDLFIVLCNIFFLNFYFIFNILIRFDSIRNEYNIESVNSSQKYYNYLKKKEKQIKFYLLKDIFKSKILIFKKLLDA